MKSCALCGQLLQDEARFCVACGASMGDSEAAAVLSVEPANLPNTQTTGSPKKKVLVGVLVAILIITVSFFGWQRYSAQTRSQARLDLAVKYLSDNNYDQAVLAFNDAINIEPREVKAYQGLAKTYTLQKNYDQAKTAYDQGLKAVAGDKRDLLSLGLAGMYIDKGDLAEAEHRFQTIIDGNKAAIPAYRGLALVYQLQGNKSRAREVLEQCLQVNGGNQQAYSVYAGYLADMQEKDKALDIIAASLEGEINQQAAYTVLDKMYRNNWKSLVSRTDALNRHNISAMLKFYAYYSNGEWSQAITFFKENLEWNKNLNKAYVLEAICLAQNGDRAAAEAIIKEQTGKKLNEAVMSDIARYYLAIGDNQKALDWVNRSLSINDQDIDTVNLLVQIYGSDNVQAARQAQAKYLAFTWMPVKVASNPNQTWPGTPASGSNTSAQGNSQVVKKTYNHALDDSLENAAYQNKTSDVKSLLAAGADPNTLWEGSNPVLSLAASRGNLDMVKALLEAGADVNKRNSAWGTTPLSMAALGGNTEIVKMLLTAGAVVEAKDVSGNTAINNAMETYQGSDAEQAKCLEILIAAGANVNAKDSSGETALIGASHWGKTACVKVLLAAGADVTPVDLRKMTALDHAELMDRNDIISLLHQYGAKD